MNKIILLTLYLDGTISQESLLSVVRLFNHSNLFFETIDYSITYLSPNSSYKTITRKVKYSDNTINDFYKYHNTFKSVLYSSIEINKLSHKNDFKILDTGYSILYSIGDSFNTITLAISENFASEIDFKALAINSIHILLSDSCGLFYGVSNFMSASKLPLLYVNGITNNNLDSNEIESVERLNEHPNDIREKIWELSWGNLINSKQFVDDKTPNILNGKRYLNTVEFSDYLIWFNFDCDITDFTKYSNCHRRELLTYFKEKLLL